MNKLMNISDAVKLIRDGDTLGVGGNVLHRAPMALIRETVRQGRRDLKVVKTAGAMDVDMLCFGGCVKSVDAGFISYETEFSLADHYRRAVQGGTVKANEHACYTVMSALRAAVYGIPFMPVKGLMVSDLIDANDYFTRMADPFSGEMITVVKAIAPDVTIIHVQEADIRWNSLIYGPKFDDVLLAKKSKKIIVSAEKIVDTSKFQADTKLHTSSQKVDIPGFMVSAVVHAPVGAAPCSCQGYYDIDRDHIKAFKAMKDAQELSSYLDAQKIKDYR